MGWTAAFVVSVYLFGFKIGLPLAGGLFCIGATRWESRARHAVFTFVVVVVLLFAAIGFIDILHLQYSGLVV